MNRRNWLLLLAAVLAAALPAGAQEAMWGHTRARNMVSEAVGLPVEWDVATGEGVLWSAPLGSQTYAGPLLAGGKLFVGTNNQGLRDPRLTGDRGVLMAFARPGGAFLWQSTHTKLPAGRVNDWPQQGICSTPYVDGDRLYYVSNQARVVCVDTEGFADGENDGPLTGEASTGPADADLVWSFDMIEELDVFPHNLATCSPAGLDDLLFVVTSNGVDEGHVHIPSPFAPSFIALRKSTGELVWEDASPGMGILHGQWSNPAVGVMGGRPQVLFPGGDGWLYAFEPETGELIWKFDCNPKDSVWELGGRGTRNNLISTPVIVGDRVYLGVGQDPEHGEGRGNLWCIDGTGTGDVTDSHAVWHLGGEEYNRTMSTAAVHEGLLYTADLSGFVYCLDAGTGEKRWTYDTFAAIWGSPLVADGKVYVGDEDGDVTIFRAGPELEVIAEINMGSAMYTTPAAEDGILYLASRNTLFALGSPRP